MSFFNSEFQCSTNDLNLFFVLLCLAFHILLHFQKPAGYKLVDAQQQSIIEKKAITILFSIALGFVESTYITLLWAIDTHLHRER